jgi:hypothetical protein
MAPASAATGLRSGTRRTQPTTGSGICYGAATQLPQKPCDTRLRGRASPFGFERPAPCSARWYGRDIPGRGVSTLLRSPIMSCSVQSANGFSIAVWSRTRFRACPSGSNAHIRAFLIFTASWPACRRWTPPRLFAHNASYTPGQRTDLLFYHSNSLARLPREIGCRVDAPGTQGTARRADFGELGRLNTKHCQIP